MKARGIVTLETIIKEKKEKTRFRNSKNCD